MISKCFFIVALIGAVWAQSEFDLGENFSLPPDLEGKIDEKQIATVKNQTLKAFKQKCEENGGAGAFERSEDAYKNLMTCMKELVDTKVLQQEIEDAKPHGEVDDVFKKYCAKTPSFKKCIVEMTESVKPCLSDKERENLKTVYNVTEQMADFICFKEGDRIALFIAEGGKECFEDKQEDLRNCTTSIFGEQYQTNLQNITVENLPSLSFGHKECDQLDKYQVCMLGVLETCPAPTIANIVEAMFKFLRKATPCNDNVPETRQAVPGAATSLTTTTAVIVSLVASIRLF